jgi:hypothetical protein
MAELEVGSEHRGRCASCNAELIWAKTTAGKLMPVDFAPSLRGNVEIISSSGGGVLYARVAKAPIPGGRARTSHFATCPAAGEWRRPAGERQ